MLRHLAFAGRNALVSFALLSGIGAVYAGNADAVMTIASVPTTASISRDAAGSAASADFYASYTVSITNPSNSSKNFRFIGDVTVAGGSGAVPTNLVSSRADCTLTTANPVRVTCPKLEVAKQTTVRFSLQFRTPTDGTQMELLGNLYFPVSSTSLTASTSATTTLVKLNEPEYTLGFNTFVPRTGGTFWTGNNGNLAGSPGGVATAADPWTTTVVIPAINFTTTASALEEPSGVGCGGYYTSDASFATNLNIPGAFESLVIYLRIDSTKHNPLWSIWDTSIKYTHDGGSPVPVRNCAIPVPDPRPGNPCIEKRTLYGNDAPVEWRGDWEFKIRALDNGRYIN